MAGAAGISAEWYVKLEQGRAVAPSSATIESLARALLLDDVDRAHLCSLARTTPRAPFVREEVPGTISRLIKSFAHPAYVTGQRWDVLAWNSAAAELLFDFDQLAIEDRNILLCMLTDPRARTLFGDHWAQEARRMIALFRATHDLFADDPAFVDLISRLRGGCTEFDTWWSTHDVRSPVSGKKIIYHPSQGALSFEYTSFQANDDPRLKVAIYLAG